MITLKNVSFTYSAADSKSLTNINLTIHDGECVVLTGLSGCGKTTLTRVLNGLCPQFYDGVLEGEYRIDHKDAGSMSAGELSQYWGSVFQDPRSQFFAKRVQDEIVLAMENACFDRSNMERRLHEVCTLLGITHLLDEDMMYLSSGEKQKVAIASVCCVSPRGYVFDEPSANLDTAATHGLSQFLQKMKKDGHTIVVSEHRLHYLKSIIDRLIVLKDGAIYQELSREKALRLTSGELHRMGLRSFVLPAVTAAGTAPFDASHTERNGVMLRGICYAVPGKMILDDVRYRAACGNVHVITGENGAGKSSLCRCLSGLHKEKQGTVSIDGMLLKRRARIQRCFFVQQDTDYQLYGFSLEDEFNIGKRKKYTTAQIREALQSVGIGQELTVNPHILSGGQKQRLLIAVAAASERQVLIFDEPTSGLDGYHMALTAQLLRQLAASGKTVIVITHDIAFIASVADTLCYFSGGKLHYHNYIRHTAEDCEPYAPLEGEMMQSIG